MRGAGHRPAALAAAALVTVAVGATALSGGAGAATSVCLGDPSASGVPVKPGPPVRFGIAPAGEAGALGPRVPFVADQPDRTLAALNRLHAPGKPLVLRLNRFFWADGEAGIERFLALAQHYTSHGFPVELQVRYHPSPSQVGDVAGFAAFVREVVRRFGPNRGVVALQITNEVNFTVSPDSSDGAYAGARDALIQGVIAAKDEARRRGFAWLTVGFNWFYRTDPDNEDSFWTYLGEHGGAPFVAALDWVGLDVYPGTVFPPTEPPGGERDGVVNALSTLRQCWLPKAGILERVPIHIEENGWPTGPGRDEAKQARVLEDMVRTVDRFRGTYNVSDYRWFDLRDHNSSSANFQHHYGLLSDDYTPKPAFEVYRRLVAELAAAEAPGAPRRSAGRPRVHLALRYAGGGRCGRARVRATVAGADRPLIQRVDFYRALRRVGRDARAPFSRVFGLASRRRPSRIHARVTLRDGRRRTLTRNLRRCR